MIRVVIRLTITVIIIVCIIKAGILTNYFCPRYFENVMPKNISTPYIKEVAIKLKDIQ